MPLWHFGTEVRLSLISGGLKKLAALWPSWSLFSPTLR